MIRRPATLAAIAAASLLPGAAAAQLKGGTLCQVTRILADGREIRSTAKETTISTSTGSHGSRSHASSTSRGRSSAASSVSVSSSSSSSSSSARGSSARARSSYTDDRGRIVTTTRDENGCRTVIDERQGE